MSTFGVYFACFCFPSRPRCLLSVVCMTYAVSTFSGACFLFGVYIRCLLCVLLLPTAVEVSTFCGPYYRLEVYFLSLLCALLLSVAAEVSTFCGPYDLRGVYCQCWVRSTGCLLSVSTLRASAFRRGRGVYFLWFV